MKHAKILKAQIIQRLPFQESTDKASEVIWKEVPTQIMKKTFGFPAGLSTSVTRVGNSVGSGFQSIKNKGSGIVPSPCSITGSGGRI